MMIRTMFTLTRDNITRMSDMASQRRVKGYGDFNKLVIVSQMADCDLFHGRDNRYDA